MCLTDIDNFIFVICILICILVFQSVIITFENDGLGKFKTV